MIQDLQFNLPKSGFSDHHQKDTAYLIAKFVMSVLTSALEYCCRTPSYQA